MAGNDYDGIKYREEKGSPLIFRLLLAGLVLWGVPFMGYYLFSGWSSDKEFTEKQKHAASKSAEFELKEKTAPARAAAGKGGDVTDYVAAGKKIFTERCVACHGSDAKGGIGPDLTRADFKFGKTESAILESVSNGRPGGMPGFGKELSHEQLEGVVKYLLTIK